MVTWPASVTDVAVEPVKESCYVNVTFTVDEGDLYTIDSVKAPGTSLMSEEELLAVIPIKPGATLLTGSSSTKRWNYFVHSGVSMGTFTLKSNQA